MTFFVDTKSLRGEISNENYLLTGGKISGERSNGLEELTNEDTGRRYGFYLWRKQTKL